MKHVTIEVEFDADKERALHVIRRVERVIAINLHGECWAVASRSEDLD